MTTIEAKNLQVNDVIVKGEKLLQVKCIERLSDKAITIRTKRIAPDLYDGDFFHRFMNNTKIIVQR